MSIFGKFSPRLQEAIVARLGWTSLRPVQELAGEALLAGKNAVVLAPTAGGKTEASMFPVLSELVERAPDGVGAIYVAPIKALLNNQAERLGLYTEMVGLSRFVWHGDTVEHERKRFLAEPCDLLMTTPESLEVMLISQRVDERKLFGDLRYVVIDEVHAIAGSDRGAHLMSVLERLAQVSRHDVQRVGLSATVGNPDTILDWLRGTSQREGTVVDPPKQPSKRQLLIVYRPDLQQVARAAAQMAKGCKSLFFCQSRSTSEAVAEYLRRADTNVFVHHSAVSKEERALAEEKFHHGSDACIVCTSTLELGIDVGDLDKVLQAEAPETVSSFLQRMGRTGRRAGQSANTTFFCESSDGVLQAIAIVELAKARWVESIRINDRCWPVLIHQLLAMSLASDGIPRETAWQHLSRLPDFRGIERAEFDRLLDWMIADQALVELTGRLLLGPTAERRFGRRNFKELFAVFTSPVSYTVQTASGQSLGSLGQAFVDQLVDGVSCFLLGGRAWSVLHVQHDDRRIHVEPAPRGRNPTWGGFLPQFLGREVSQKIRDVLQSTEEFAYLTPEAAEVLAQRRTEYSNAQASGTDDLQLIGSDVWWWTYAGGRINSTLRYLLQALHPEWTLTPDNFSLRIRGEDVTVAHVQAEIRQLYEPLIWNDAALWESIAAGLPNYRLSKFQPLMPDWVEREVVADYLLDASATRAWLVDR